MNIRLNGSSDKGSGLKPEQHAIFWTAPGS